MRSKKSFLSLGILALVLFLGVGYAVVSSVYVNLGGTANAAGADLNVEITNAVATTNISEKTVDFNHVLSDSNLTSDFTLNNMTLGEIVTITYTVTNNETDVDAVLSLASGVTLNNSNPDYFKVDYDITDATTDLENNDKTMTVVVTIELIKTPVTEENSSTTVGLTLTASPAGADSSLDSGNEDTPIVMYSYNGHILPKVPEVTEAEPYVQMIEMTEEMINSNLTELGMSELIGTIDSAYAVAYSSCPLEHDASDDRYDYETFQTTCEGTVTNYISAPSIMQNWELIKKVTTNDSRIYSTFQGIVVWSNYDLMLEDGSLYLAASDPVLVQ